MKTKILLIASGVVLTAGAAMHVSNGNCPLGKNCQKLFKSEQAAVKSEKITDPVKTETSMPAKK